MKVLMWDPSGTTNYCNGLADALSSMVELTVVVRDNFITENESNYIIHCWIKSTGRGKLCRLKKAVSYYTCYFRTLHLAKKEKYDVIHIQWCLQYKTDYFFIKLLKKYCNCVVYTAHNVLPHTNGVKYKKQLYKIYKLVDKIIVHGDSIKKELLETFDSISASKIYIQYHGADIRKIENVNYFNNEINRKINETKGKIVLYLGVIFDNKGVDRLFRYWNRNSKMHKDDLMIVAGMVTEANEEYIKLANEFASKDNALYLPERVPVDLHDYLYQNADLVVLPYKKASMSGVVFDAALFSKTILTTSEGSISEYLIDGEDSFVVDNNEENFENKLRDILVGVSKEELKRMGYNLNDSIYKKYSWKEIVRKLVNDIY